MKVGFSGGGHANTVQTNQPEGESPAGHAVTSEQP